MAKASAAGEHLPGVVAADVFVDAVGRCARSSQIDQVDQSTSVSCQGDALLPHLSVASGKRGRGMRKMCHNLEGTANKLFSSAVCGMSSRYFTPKLRATLSTCPPFILSRYLHVAIVLLCSVISHDVDSIHLAENLSVRMVERRQQHVARDSDFHFAGWVVEIDAAVQ